MRMYITSGMIELKDGKIAIFDLDFVLFRPSFYTSLIQTFTSNEFYSNNVRIDTDLFIKAWSEGKVSYEEYVRMITKLSIENVNVFPRKDLKNLIVPILKDKKNFYDYPYALINLLKKQGYYIFGYSNLPSSIVTPFSKHYGFHISVANNLKTIPSTTALPQKDRVAVYLKNFSSVFSLQNSIAVGGTKNSIDILELVGRPIVFNSDKELTSYAKDKAWDTIREDYKMILNH